MNNILKRSSRKSSIVLDCIQAEQVTDKYSIYSFSSKIYMIKYEMKL